MKPRTQILSVLLAAALSGGAFAQGAGGAGGGAGSTGSEGPAPRSTGAGAGTGSSAGAPGSVPSTGGAAAGGGYSAGSDGGPSSGSPMSSGSMSGSSGSMSSSGTSGAGTSEAGGRSRAEVQREATEALRDGRIPRGDPLMTRNRPHGGPINADAPVAPAPGPAHQRPWYEDAD